MARIHATYWAPSPDEILSREVGNWDAKIYLNPVAAHIEMEEVDLDSREGLEDGESVDATLYLACGEAPQDFRARVLALADSILSLLVAGTPITIIPDDGDGSDV
jgi:hypothetical protein